MILNNNTCKIILVLLIVILAALPDPIFAQKDQNNSISPFALSVNPLGVLQFGPIINMEFGFPNNLVLNIHTRFHSAGLLSYVTPEDNHEIDDLSGIAFGAGLLYFMTERKHKPYIGALIEYHTHDILYSKGDIDEWERTDKGIVLIANGGYRFRFNSGFFMNAGAYLGAAILNYEWKYTDPTYFEYGDDDNEGTDITPFGMI
ncbi:MAG: hypothetical protein P8X42_07600 [Calditrichaceae bacterium]